MMKPYFKAGNNYKDFIQVWLDEEVREGNMSKVKEKGCYEKYILILPGTRYYLFSKVVFMFTTLWSFIYVPYVTFVKDCSLESPYLEICIVLDVFWLIHMI
jgi:hypothetical protein